MLARHYASWLRDVTPVTLHRISYTLYPNPYTLNSTSYTLNSKS